MHRAALQARESEHKREAEAAKARHAEHLRQVMSQVGAEARDRSATPRVRCVTPRAGAAAEVITAMAPC